MSPIVLHGPRGIVSKDIGYGNNKLLHPSVTIWTKPCARVFQNSTFPMYSNSICHKTTMLPLLKSASDEAVTVTENGVIEIEDGMHSYFATKCSRILIHLYWLIHYYYYYYYFIFSEATFEQHLKEAGDKLVSSIYCDIKL